MSRIGNNNPGHVNFQDTVNNLDAQGKANLAEAGVHADAAVDNVEEAAANAGGFFVNVAGGIADAGRPIGPPCCDASRDAPSAPPRPSPSTRHTWTH